MKKLKKILLIVGITMLLAVIGVASVSASSVSNKYYYVNDNGVSEVDLNHVYDNNGYALVLLPEDSMTRPFDSEVLVGFNYVTDENYVCYLTDTFYEVFVYNILYNKSELESIYNTRIDYSAESFLNFINNYYISNLPIFDLGEFGMSEYTSPECVYEIFQYFLNDFPQQEDYTEEQYEQYLADVQEAYSNYRNSLCQESFCIPYSIEQIYIETYGSYITEYGMQKNIEASEKNISVLEGQVTELNTSITEKNTAISNLESQNNKLEMNVAGLNSQVSALVEDRTELNAQIKSLENQMQLKINKAYAEGLADSDGEGNRVNKLISTLVIILTVVEVVALIAFIVSKARKNKHR